MKSTRAQREPEIIASNDDLVLGLSTVLAASLGLGLFAAGQNLPLPWMVGQKLYVGLLIAVLAIATVYVQHRQSQLTGVWASGYGSRARMATFGVVGLCTVALPVLQMQGLARPVDTGRFALTLVISAGVSLLVVSFASSLLRLWAELQLQPWERGLAAPPFTAGTGVEAGGRAERARIVRDLWTWWLGGNSALAIAFLVTTQAESPVPLWTRTVLLLAFALYSVAGLILLGISARLRQTNHWTLEGITVAPSLNQQWLGLNLKVAGAAVICIVVLLAAHVLDVIYAAEDWLIWHCIAPLLALISGWSLHGSAPHTCDTGASCGKPLTPAAPVLPRSKVIPGGDKRSISIDWSWFQHYWPLLVALIASLILLYAFIGARRDGTGGSLLREMFAVLVRDLRKLFQLFRFPVRSIAIGIRSAVERRLDGSQSARKGRGARYDSSEPRQAIIQLYLATLRFAAHRGYPRPEGQTATEYAEKLGESVPDSTPLNDLTELFIRARYSNIPPDDQGVTRMKAAWKSFRALLPRRSSKEGR